MHAMPLLNAVFAKVSRERTIVSGGLTEQQIVPTVGTSYDWRQG